MESKTTAPSFTVSLRGYDRMEVDEYLDSLAEALSQVDELQEQNRLLQAQVARAESRVKELEDHIRADTPRTGAILGERISILLRSAEETAADTIARAEVEAARIAEDAAARLAEAADEARASVARGEEQARRIDAAARAEAAEIISEAEARAGARTRQIEQWAEQVVSHTRAEEARMRREHQEARDAANAELRSLAETRDRAADTLAELREQLGRALGLVVTAPPAMVGAPADTAPARRRDGTDDSGPGAAAAAGPGSGSAEAEAEAEAEMPWPHAEPAHDARPAGSAPEAAADGDREPAAGGPEAATAAVAEVETDDDDGDRDDPTGATVAGTVAGRSGGLYDDEADEGVVIILSDRDPVRSEHPAAGHDTAGYDTAGYDTAGRDTAGHDTSGFDAGAATSDPTGDDTGQIEAVAVEPTAAPAGGGDAHGGADGDSGPASIDVTTGPRAAGAGAGTAAADDDDEFEAKLEAWVSNNVPVEGPRHFKRS